MTTHFLPKEAFQNLWVGAAFVVVIMGRTMTNIASRKAQRKEKRLKRKRFGGGGEKREEANDDFDPGPHSDDAHQLPRLSSPKNESMNSKKSESKTESTAINSQNYSTKKKRRMDPAAASKSNANDPYAHLDPAMAAAMRRDDDEIADLERKLGMSQPKEKERLKREYAKLECYGDDFGDFLDDLDDLVRRVGQPPSGGTASQRMVKNKHPNEDSDESYLENHDGNNSDDAPSFFESQHEESDGDEDEEDEIVPMKEPAEHYLDEDDSVLEEIEALEKFASHDSSGDEEEEEEEEDDDDDDGDETVSHGDLHGSDDEISNGSSSDSEEDENTKGTTADDIGEEHTYRPSKGEDIYGNQIDSPEQDGSPPKKYVPPHLRQRKTAVDTVTNEESAQQRAESIRSIQRLLNNALNRLSEDNFVSVSQTIAKLYPMYPTSNVNESIWINTRNACVATVTVMNGLIPVYVAALVGVHVQKGDAAQLGEYLLEMTIVDLMNAVATARAERSDATTSDETESSQYDKKSSNLILILCYLYNFGVVHCSLMYDVVRDLISHFDEIDLELLLLILSHSGRALRSDDPSALKEIVLLVQKRATQENDINRSNNSQSRVDYMISAMTDLKNNKRRKADMVHSDRTTKLRKLLGQIKSMTAAAGGTSIQRSSDSSLRISLQDILNADTKGRWWRVGASWVGNQFQLVEAGSTEQSDRKHRGKSKVKDQANTSSVDKEDEKLLKLAVKYRMNTDMRRSIFCIIMGSVDCDDSFEKLVRAGMLKNRSERESVRVLMECCGNEQTYNKYYSHLAARICEYQPQCKFSFQLAFWDFFKQFDEMKARRAANLAKLLYSLIVNHHALKLHVLKVIDMSSPDELSENALIFLTIFFSSILEHFREPSQAADLFIKGIPRSRSSGNDYEANDDNDLEEMDEGDALRASLTIFLVQVMKASPKYKKGSKFHANLKAVISACDPDKMLAE